MNHHYKTIAQVSFGLLGFVGLLLLSIFYLRGVVWASATFFPWLVAAGAIALIVCNVILLPLSVFKRTRSWAGLGYYYSSYVFGTLLFAYSCIAAYKYWGYVGLFVGLFMAGIGVLPIAYLATIVHHDWQIVGNLAVGTAATFGLRAFGVYLALEKESQRVSGSDAVYNYDAQHAPKADVDYDATAENVPYCGESDETSLHEFGHAHGKVQVESTPQKIREDREVGSSCDEGPLDEQSRRIDESTKEHGFAYEQVKAFDNKFEFDATVLTWRFIHQALEIALSKGYTSTEIARSFTHNLAQAIAESGAIVPESAEKRVALSATGLAWRGIHSTLLCSLVRRESLPHPEVTDQCAQHIGSFTERLEIALVDGGVLSIAQVTEIRQQSLTVLVEAITTLPVMTQAIWENDFGGIGLPTEAEIWEKLAELQTEIKQREFFAAKLEERGEQAAGNTGARMEEIRDEDIPF